MRLGCASLNPIRPDELTGRPLAEAVLVRGLSPLAGTVFVKGLRVGHPGVVRQGREAMINPFVRTVAPRLPWHDQAEALAATASGARSTP